jgi:hypothetical protein
MATPHPRLASRGRQPNAAIGSRSIAATYNTSAATSANSIASRAATTAGADAAKPVWILLLVAAIAGVAEEIAFRGVLIDHVGTLLGSRLRVGRGGELTAKSASFRKGAHTAYTGANELMLERREVKRPPALQPARASYVLSGPFFRRSCAALALSSAAIRA